MNTTSIRTVAAAFAAGMAVSGSAASLPERVRADFPQMPASGICRYWVPAMSERQYLPDAYPEDGKAGWPVKIVAARGEYEPGAFLLYSTKDTAKMSFTVGALKNEKGDVFPAGDLDLKTVKVWYQNGNGWFSYFQDVKLKLCPELLLHDEDLVRVDTVKKGNWARLTEKDGSVSEFWLTAPRGVHRREMDISGERVDDTFACMKENFCDAPTFAGARLAKGAFKEFILTAHVRKGTKAGVYRGAITLADGGRKVDEVPVELKVLDFDLPKPKTYFDVEKDFDTRFCEYLSYNIIRQANGNDQKLAEKQLVAIVKDYVAHGQDITMCGEMSDEKMLPTARAIGVDVRKSFMRPMHLGEDAEVRYAARLLGRKCDRLYGTRKGLFCSWGDEYGLSTLKGIRDMVKIYHDEGFRFPVNSHSGYCAGANLADLWWPPYSPDGRSAATTFKYNQLGGDGQFGWYASQHVGVENPAFVRRQYGFGPYRAGFGCNFNYAHHFLGWNDIEESLYKPMMLAYGSGDGCIDTLAWEGLREGLDDIRYATLLKQLALPLVKNGSASARYAAKIALKLLADADGDDFDLTTFRLEMIRQIEVLRKF